MFALAAVATLVLAFSGCASRPAAGSAAANEPAGLLATERQWLQSWFKGTPVAITQRGDGPVAIEVPREFSFDPGRSTVKPALGAVLDKVAESLRRVPANRLHLIAAPGDAATDAPLALRRATQLRSHLISRGVPAAQIGDPTVAKEPAVQLQLAARANPS